MIPNTRCIAVSLLFLATILAFAEGLPGIPAASQGPKFPVNRNSPYHKHPAKIPLLPTLDPGQFAEMPVVYVAYSVAARIREVLYQEPCFCPCNKFAGHRSLLDCYTSTHGKECAMCQYEAFFVFEQSSRGKSPKQIRKAMLNNRWGGLRLDEFTENYFRTVIEKH